MKAREGKEQVQKLRCKSLYIYSIYAGTVPDAFPIPKFVPALTRFTLFFTTRRPKCTLRQPYEGIIWNVVPVTLSPSSKMPPRRHSLTNSIYPILEVPTSLRTFATFGSPLFCTQWKRSNYTTSEKLRSSGGIDM